jgi:hypothetical protein
MKKTTTNADKLVVAVQELEKLAKQHHENGEIEASNAYMGIASIISCFVIEDEANDRTLAAKDLLETIGRVVEVSYFAKELVGFYSK